MTNDLELICQSITSLFVQLMSGLTDRMSAAYSGRPCIQDRRIVREYFPLVCQDAWPTQCSARLLHSQRLACYMHDYKPAAEVLLLKTQSI